MFCQNCGTEFEGKFCPNCGTPAARNISAESSGAVPRMPAQTPEPDLSQNQNRSPLKKKKKAAPIVPVVVIVIALFASCSLLFGNSPNRSGNTSSNTGPRTETVKREDPPETETASENEETVSAESEEIQNERTEENGSEALQNERTGENGSTPPENETIPAKTADYTVNREFFYDYISSLGDHIASAYVEIENTGNTTLYLTDGKFDIEDNNGHLLKSNSMISTCPDAILPGERGYFHTDYIDLSDVDTSNGMVFVPHYKVEEARHEVVDYEVSDLAIREDSVWKCTVSGRLTNTTEKDINYIYVHCVFYDAEGTCIGISGTNMTDIEAGETESFEIIGQFFRNDTNYSDIAEYRVVPRDWYIQF